MVRNGRWLLVVKCAWWNGRWQLAKSFTTNWPCCSISWHAMMMKDYKYKWKYKYKFRLAPLYDFMTETMMTKDYSNPLVYWSVMGEMMSHFEVTHSYLYFFVYVFVFVFVIITSLNPLIYWSIMGQMMTHFEVLPFSGWQLRVYFRRVCFKRYY